MKITPTLVKRAVLTALGLVVVGLGVGTFLFAGLGMDPVSVFVEGLAIRLGSSYGVASLLFNIAVLTVVFFVDRSYINFASLLAMFLVGFSADAAEALLSALVGGEMSFFVSVLFALVGCAVMSFGVAVYIAPGMGVGASDSISQMISDKSGWNYRWVRIGADVFFIIVGWLIGGPVGVGTLIGALLTGPIVQLCRPAAKKINRLIVGE